MSGKKPVEEARSRLTEKLVDVKQKAQSLHDLISSITDEAIFHAESTLKHKSKTKFLNKYPQVSQELEICLNRLLILSDAVSSVNDDDGSDNEGSSSEEGYDFATDLTETQSKKWSKRRTKPDDAGFPSKKRRSCELPVTCPQCHKQLKGAYSLKLHVKSQHTPEADFPYGCTLCPKRYARRDYLKEHIDRVHLKQCRHHCGQCGRGFDRPGKRDTHQNKCTGTMDHVTMSGLAMNTPVEIVDIVEVTETTEANNNGTTDLDDANVASDSNNINDTASAGDTAEIEEAIDSVKNELVEHLANVKDEMSLGKA